MPIPDLREKGNGWNDGSENEEGDAMANKLELTWYGKDTPIRVEPRLLIENAALSNCAASPDTENMLIHGDNLLAPDR